MGTERTLALRPESIEHFIQLHTHASVPGASGWQAGFDPARAALLAGRMRDLGIWNSPTLVTHGKTFTLAEKTVFLQQTPELRFLPPQIIERWRNSPVFNNPSIRDSVLANQMQMLRAVQDFGAGMLLLGTDAGFVAIIPGFTIHEELQIYVNSGLTPYQALRAGTWNAAQFEGKSGEFGSVREGLRADLLLLEANPLLDVRNVARRRGVMVRGRWLPEEELRRRLEEQARRFAQPQARTTLKSISWEQ